MERRLLAQEQSQTRSRSSLFGAPIQDDLPIFDSALEKLEPLAGGPVD
jgi:hypothetical protein